MARKSFTFTESIYAPDLVKIMQAAEGPFTRSMLAEKLGELHPLLAAADERGEQRTTAGQVE